MASGIMEEMATARAHAGPGPGTLPRLRSRISRMRALQAGAGLAVVFYLLTRMSMMDRLPYIGDEGWHGTFVVQVGESLGNLWVSLTIAKEPLAIWIATVFTKLGVEPMDAMRLVSVCAGLATVIVVGLFARHVAGAGAGLAAMAIGAALPLWLVLDTLGLMDALIAAEVVAALYLQVRLAERPRLGTALLLGLVLAAAVLTKESGKSAVALVPLSLLCFDWSAPEVRARLLRWAGFAALAAGMAGLAYAWMRSSSLWGEAEQLRRIPIEYPVRPLSSAFVDPIGAIRDNAPEYRVTMLAYFTVPLLLAAAGGWVLLLRERPAPRPAPDGMDRRSVRRGAAAALQRLRAPRDVPHASARRARGDRGLAGGLLRARPLGGTALRARRGRRRRGAGLHPALMLDARILADPAEAKYPGADTYQYVRGPSGGAIWPEVADEIRRRTGGRPAIVMKSAAVTFVLEFLLDDPDITFVYGDDPRAQRAQLILQDSLPFPDPAGRPLLDSGRFRLVRTFTRPRNGFEVKLCERRR